MCLFEGYFLLETSFTEVGRLCLLSLKLHLGPLDPVFPSVLTASSLSSGNFAKLSKEGLIVMDGKMTKEKTMSSY